MLLRIIERLVEAYQPDRIYLFGSKPAAGSDFDLMVVVPQTTERVIGWLSKAHSLLWDIGTAADILVWNQQAFEPTAPEHRSQQPLYAKAGCHAG